MRTTKITQLFEAVQTVVVNLTENENLQQAMDMYGFTAARVQEGNTLLNNARMLYSTQHNHYDNARRISLQIAQDSAAAQEAFKDHVSIARAAFRREPHMLQELKIKKIPHAQWAMLQQAIQFYDKAKDYIVQLQPFGANVELFQQNKAAIEALLVLKAQRLKKKGDAEDSTEQKNQSIKALRAWYGEFRKLARIAFQDSPQVLETFGMVVPSST